MFRAVESPRRTSGLLVMLLMLAMLAMLSSGPALAFERSVPGPEPAAAQTSDGAVEPRGERPVNPWKGRYCTATRCAPRAANPAAGAAGFALAALAAARFGRKGRPTPPPSAERG